MTFVNDIPCALNDITSDHLVVTPTDSWTDDMPEEVVVTQKQVLVNPKDIFQQLRDFWNPYWNKSEEDLQLTDEFQTFLDQLRVNFPAPAIDIHDQSEWELAIRQLRSSSCRGIDAISAAELQMLPLSAVHDLSKVLTSYEQGFPEWFMTSITFALSKTNDIPVASQTRPITVMAQLYRLWSKVICKQLLCHFSLHFGPDITGFLRSRGPMDATYLQQWWLEFHHTQRQAASGFSLDLIKCFNTINRSAVHAILQKLLVPSEILRQWYCSLQHLKRLWIIQSQCSEPQPANNGCPEGDTFSVICMLALAFTWTSAIRRLTNNPCISAFADNWGWSTNDPNDHRCIFEVTIAFVRATGMSIDWQKSWLWATQKQHAQVLKQALSRFLDPDVVKQVQGAFDLGCQMTYHGPPKLGQQRNRFEKAMKKLQTLQRLIYDIRVKAHLVVTGILPIFCYGVELLPIGKHHVDTLRIQIADAVHGSNHSRNTSMSVLMTPHLQDPVVVIIVKVLRTCRRILGRMTSVEQDRFFEVASQHKGQAHNCRGPASCLKFYLLWIGWTISKQGFIHTFPGVSVHLVHSSLRTLARLCQKAWESQVLIYHSDRKSWRGLPPPDALATHKILLKFSPKEQHRIIQEISGSFQLATQKQKWDSQATDSCWLCGQPDSREHRALQCPATAEIREPFEDVISFFQDRGSNVCDLPIQFRHHLDEYFMMVHQQHEEPILSPDLQTHLDTLQSNGYRVRVFTDGSCQHPETPQCSFAAYAAVIDLCTSDQERLHIVAEYRTTLQAPSNFVPLILGRTPGEQRIHRSELFCITKICEILTNAEIFTDSASSLDVISRCQHVSSKFELMHLEDFEIVERLWEALKRGSFVFHKIDAHCLPQATHDDMLCFNRLGNKKADELAVTACWNLCPRLVAEHENIFRDQHNFPNMLFQWYKLLLALQVARAKLVSVANAEQRVSEITTHPQSTLAKLSQWHFSEVWEAPALRVDSTKHCFWGGTYAKAILLWMHEVKWPTLQIVTDSDPGITWIELFTSFVLHSGLMAPIKRQTDAKEILIFIGSKSDIPTYDAKFSEMVASFSNMIAQLRDLTDPWIWPTAPKGFAKSTYQLGSSVQSSGFRVRPQIPCQIQTMAILQQYFATNKGPAFGIFPEMPLGGVYDASIIRRELDGDLSLKNKRVHLEAKNVRKWRSGRQNQLRF